MTTARRTQGPSRSGGAPAAVDSVSRELPSAGFLALVSGVSLAVALIAVGFYRAQAGAGYPLDDSWIHLTYARNLVSGLGFGANPHEPTPGATSPLWVLALAPGFGVGLDHVAWPWLLAAIWLAITGVASALLVLQLGTPAQAPRVLLLKAMALACAVSVTSTAPLVWSAAGAMEVPLFTALLCLAMVVHVRTDGRGLRRGLLWGVLAGLAALARPEGLLLAVILVGARLARRSREAAIEAGAALATCALVYSPSVIFCLATSGRVFPNTFYAKTTALVAGLPDPAFLLNAALLYWKLAPMTLLAFILGVGALGLAWRRGRSVEGALVVGAFALALPMAYAAMGRTFLFAGLAGNFGRYLYPAMPIALALGFWGLWTLAAELSPGSGQWLAGTVAVVVLAVSAGGAYERVSLYVHNVRDIEGMQVAMAVKLQDRLEPGSLVAANDVGALAYFTDFRVLDLVGIISTQTLDALEQAGLDERERGRALGALIERERPAGLVVFPNWYSGTLSRLGASRTAIAEVDNPDNITSGGSRLVAYRLDWRAEPD